ncbi:MAG: response regulator [Desulfobacterales bacterium]|nr:response regulator [Desulfobacterales bacterium]
MIIEKMSEGVVGINTDGRIIYANPSFFSLLALTGHEIYGSYFVDLFSGTDRIRVNKLIKKKEGKSHTISEESPLCLKEHLVTLDFLPFKEQGFSRIIVNDITERKRAEGELRREKENFRILVEESPLGTSFIEKNGRYKYINPRFTDIFGYTLADIPTGAEWFARAYPSQPYKDQVISDWVNDLKQARPGESRHRTYTVRCQDGSEKLILFRPTKLENGDQFVIYEDITEQNRLEAQLQQAQKMEAIGTLAGGIAHDFNNLMTAILGNASLMLSTTDSTHPNYNRLKTIENQVKSGTKLTEQLLGYARKGKYYVKAININRLLKDALDTFSRTRKEIRLNFELAEDLFSIEADEGQIEQVLLNLYVNAADAMPRGGDLYLKTKNITHREIKRKPFNPLPGKYVLMQFIDTGVGIDAETQKRIFDPFFTTKEMGRGTGLGLASVYGIIKGHGGYIDVESEVHQGTAFNIYLPASDKKIEKKAAATAKILVGGETILLVDDEEFVLKVNIEILQSFGYSVLAAKGGDEAIKIFRENKNIIDLIVLDMILPGMSGGEVFDKIKEINPDVKVLLSSGYSIDGQAEKILERGCDGFIQKPYKLKDLSLKIRTLLDKP